MFNFTTTKFFYSTLLESSRSWRVLQGIVSSVSEGTLKACGFNSSAIGTGMRFVNECSLGFRVSSRTYSTIRSSTTMNKLELYSTYVAQRIGVHFDITGVTTAKDTMASVSDIDQFTNIYNLCLSIRAINELKNAKPSVNDNLDSERVNYGSELFIPVNIEGRTNIYSSKLVLPTFEIFKFVSILSGGFVPHKYLEVSDMGILYNMVYLNSYISRFFLPNSNIINIYNRVMCEISKHSGIYDGMPSIYMQILDVDVNLYKYMDILVVPIFAVYFSSVDSHRDDLEGLADSYYSTFVGSYFSLLWPYIFNNNYLYKSIMKILCMCNECCISLAASNNTIYNFGRYLLSGTDMSYVKYISSSSTIVHKFYPDLDKLYIISGNRISTSYNFHGKADIDTVIPLSVLYGALVRGFISILREMYNSSRVILDGLCSLFNIIEDCSQCLLSTYSMDSGLFTFDDNITMMRKCGNLLDILSFDSEFNKALDTFSYEYVNFVCYCVDVHSTCPILCNFISTFRSCYVVLLLYSITDKSIRSLISGNISIDILSDDLEHRLMEFLTSNCYKVLRGLYPSPD